MPVSVTGAGSDSRHCDLAAIGAEMIRARRNTERMVLITRCESFRIVRVFIPTIIILEAFGVNCKSNGQPLWKATFGLPRLLTGQACENVI